jgi:hypothetical protein
MPSLYLTVERDLTARPSRDGARFRVRVFAQPGGPALLTSTRMCGSVCQAKREAETLFGDLDWRFPGLDDLPHVRARAVVEIGC